MRITPLVLHAARRVPALTARFSDPLAVTSISVVAGGTTTLTCSAAHGVATGVSIAVCITDAMTPNPITAAVVDDDGNIRLTTQYAHDLTTTPDPTKANAWNTSATLDGFGSALIDGVKQLIAVPNRNTLVIAPSGAVGSVTLDGGEVLLERLPFELIGYHTVTSATSTTLTMDTPATIGRNYTITAPVVVRNMRVFGSLSIETVMGTFVRDDNTPVPAGKAWMFVCPVDVRTSRSRNSKTDAIADLSDGSDYRQMVIDGFEVMVVLPAENSPGAVAAIDLAQGEIFGAVLKTFYGLKMPRPELNSTGSYIAMMESHGAASFDRVNYIHRYRFQCSDVITNDAAIPPYDWPDIAPDDIASSLYPIGAPAMTTIEISADPDEGIRRKEYPGALGGNVTLR